MPTPLTSRLWVVATPLGNLGDLSPRARQVIESADLVLAEDTRRAAMLCQRCGITASRFLSFFDHNEAERQAEVLERLEQGQNIVLISDAGTPLMADPGYRLVRACRKQGLEVSPVPGPSAAVAALSACGLPPLPYSFLGFLPRDGGSQRSLFSAFARVPGSLVFFERKNRLGRSLALAGSILGPRELAICRELTKSHEEFILTRLENAPALPQELPGEITVVIGPPEDRVRTDRETVIAMLRKEQDLGGKPRQVAARLRDKVDGWSSSEIYALLPDVSR